MFGTCSKSFLSLVMLGAAVMMMALMFLSSSPSFVEGMPCKTRIIYKTVHVPVHIIKKVPVIKEVKVPVYIKSKHHHHHEGGHHQGMGHKMGHMGGGHHGGGELGGGGGGGGFGEF